MEKKAYISPAMVSVAMNVEHHLMDASDLKKNSSSAEEKKGMDSKSSGSWDVWSSDDE